MHRLSILRFGLAFGGAFAILNFICILIIDIFGPQALAWFVSIIFHGLDMSAFVSRVVGFWMAIASIVFWFVLSGIFGVLVAWIYNLAMPKKV